jgi:hypothetical protein
MSKGRGCSITTRCTNAERLADLQYARAALVEAQDVLF